MNENKEELSLQEQIHRSLSEVFGAKKALLNRWALVVESLDEDGKDIDFLSSEGLELWESIGLLRTVQIVLEDRAVFESGAANSMYDDDDDDEDDE